MDGGRVSPPPAPLVRGAVLLLALLAAIVWHVLLPSSYYRDSAVFLEGPLPALIGAGVGLWVHRRSPTWLAVLSACAFAFLALLAALLAVGFFTAGPMRTFRAIGQLFASLYPLPFLAIAQGVLATPYALWVCWMALKTLIAWGAVGYLVALCFRPDARAWLRWRWRDVTQSWAFRRDQKQRLREYRQAYLDALKAGLPPPPRPPELMPDIAMGNGGGAQAAYWTLRIAYFLIGGTLFWWAFGEQMTLILQRLTGPLPWWMR
jgi:hypothetical protein